MYGGTKTKEERAKQIWQMTLVEIRGKLEQWRIGLEANVEFENDGAVKDSYEHILKWVTMPIEEYKKERNKIARFETFLRHTKAMVDDGKGNCMAVWMPQTANGKNIEPTMKIVIEARENELEKVNYSEKKERKRLNEESKKTTKKPAKGRKKK